MFKGFVCPVEDAKIDTDDCLHCAQANARPNCPFTAPVLKGIAERNGGRGFVGWSATTILGCPRAARLKGLIDYYLDPAEAYWAFRGQIAHAIVEDAAGRGVMTETRFARTVTIDGVPVLVTGQPDVVYPERGHLVDYKTTKKVPQGWFTYTCLDCGQVMQEGKWKLRRGVRKTCPHCGRNHSSSEVRKALAVGPPRPYGSHTAQINIYAWLVADHVAVRSAEVVYLDMERMVRVPVELWDPERTEAMVGERLAPLAAAELPPALADDAPGKWRCKYCDVQAACDALQSGATLLDLTQREEEPCVLDVTEEAEAESEEPFVVL